MSMGPGGGMIMRQYAKGDDLRGATLKSGTWRRVLSYGIPYKGMLAVFLIGVVLDATLGVIPPLVLQRLVDEGVLAGNSRLVVQLALLVAAVAVFEALVGTFTTWCSARIGEGLIRDMRLQVFDHVSAMPLAFFSRTQTGQLVSRLQSDVIGAQQAFTSTLSRVLSNGLSVVLVLAAMVALDWRLAIAAVLLFPLVLIPTRLVGRRVAALQRRSMQINGDISGLTTERFSVSGALLAKLFGTPEREHDTFALPANQRLDIGVKIAMIGRFFAASLVLVAALATAMVYGVGGVMTVRGALTIGTLTAFAGLLGRLYGPMQALTTVRVDIMSALVSFERVFEVLDLPIAIRDNPDAQDVTGPGSVVFSDVAFAYPDPASYSLSSLEPASGVAEGVGEPVLKGISFTVEPGQTVALVGDSGAGKTTITHLLARLYDVDSGQVLLGGVDVRQIRLASLRRLVGYVTQDAHMFHDTLRANLAYANPEATEEQMRTALAQAQVLDLVDRLPGGLDTVVGERGYRLSGGERQRLAIARLLLVHAPIVVLDEATAHLDSGSEHLVQQALDSAMEQRTCVVIAHRLATVRKADQILVVRDGRIIERGTHTELLAADGPYASLHATQFTED